MRRRFRWLGPVEGATPDQAVRMLGAVARRAPWARGCLPAALTLQRLLAAQGIESEVRLGVRKAGAHVQAHAWVESGGTTLFDTAAAHERFEVLERAAARP